MFSTKTSARFAAQISTLRYSVLGNPRPFFPKRPFASLRPKNQQYDRRMRENIVKKTLQENPGILNGNGSMRRRGTSFRTILVLVAASSSLTMLAYLGVQIYSVSQDKSETVRPRKVFLPLWLSVDWPWERKFAFPKYLAYLDPEFDEYISGIPNFIEELRSQHVEFSVLDELFKSKLVRDTFGIPLVLKSEDSDKFDAWIQCKYTTVHGPAILISKENGNLDLSWKWTVHPLPWWGSIDRALTASGFKLDRLDSSDAMQKTHEKSSGRVHEVKTNKDSKLKRVICTEKDYDVLFKGSFHLSNSSNTKSGKVTFTGLIDFDHMGINRGARLTSIELTVDGDDPEVSYKIV